MFGQSMTKVRTSSYTGYKKYIGGKVHYLGDDETRAAAKVLFLYLGELAEKLTSEDQNRLNATIKHVILPMRKQNGMGINMDLKKYEMIEMLKGLLAKLGESPEETGPKLFETLAHYKELVAKWPLSDSHVTTTLSRLAVIQKFITDRPLVSLDFEGVQTWTNAIIAASSDKAGEDKLSTITSKNQLAALRMFFGWMDDSGKWKCYNWRKATSSRGKCKTQQKKVKMMSLDQFAKLYLAATPRLKTFMLLAINCGHTQMELATLEREQIQGNRIERPRNKTGIWGEWPLWGHTALMLSRQMEKEGKFAFATKQGNPLVHYNPNRSDCVGLAFNRLTRQEGFKGTGFKELRKLGSQMVRNLAGLEVSQQFLAHKPKSVAEMHYNNAEPEKLNKAVCDMEGQIIQAIHKAKAEGRVVVVQKAIAA